MEILQLRLSQIDADPAFNARKVLSGLPSDEGPVASIEDLAADIHKNGLLQPLVVRPPLVEGGKYRLVVGFRRYAALSTGNIDIPVPCSVLIGNDRAARLANLAENARRANLRTWELADGCAELAADGMMQEEIAVAIGKSQGYVSGMLSCVRYLCPEVQRAWRADNPACTIRRMSEWCHLRPERQMDEFRAAIGGGSVSVDDTIRALERDARGAGGTADPAAPRMKRPRRAQVLREALAAADAAATTGVASVEARQEAVGTAKALRYALGDAETIPGVYGGRKRKSRAKKREEP